MPFEIHRRNEVKNENQVGGAQYATGELAFRAAMGNVTTYITDHWDSNPGITDLDGPGDNTKFKIYIERRPGQAEIELRFDIPTVDQTNSIYWRVVSV